MKIINFFIDILGYLLGYGTCMNCHGSFLYKKRDSLYYAHVIDIKHGEYDVGFAVCKECLSGLLNKEKIVQNMNKTGWKEDDVTMSTVAIDKHNLKFTNKK